MKLFSWFYHINPEDYELKTAACRGCIRFYKVALKEKSGLFSWLNNFINPLFDRLIESIVTENELYKARDYGKKASKGNISAEESNKWMKGQKTGF